MHQPGCTWRDRPSSLYSLRRVWLDREEEQGSYFGFANEGLWPLCHIAHTRPAFRAADCEQYRAVNQKFADVVLEEMEPEKEPLVIRKMADEALQKAGEVAGAPLPGCPDEVRLASWRGWHPTRT